LFKNFLAFRDFISQKSGSETLFLNRLKTLFR